jgi:putative FmdB family regulatory protein
VPTYQYACTECGHDFEQFQSFSEDALTVCPQCQGRLRKKYNAVGVVFKGSGFYRNDSRPADTEGKPAVAAKADATASGGSSDGAGSSGASETSTGTTEKASTGTEKVAPKGDTKASGSTNAA